MPPTGVIAYNPYGWRYNTSRWGRTQQLIVRVRVGTERNDSKVSGLTLRGNQRDDTGAGDSWSPQELDVAGYRDPKTLVVVVGEILRQEDIPQATRSAETRQLVVPPARDTQVVVRPFLGHKATLYVLRDKRQGLCVIKPLPRPALCASRVVFYEEWVSDMENPGLQWKERRRMWCARLNQFCAEQQQQRLQLLEPPPISVIWQSIEESPVPQPTEQPTVILSSTEPSVEQQSRQSTLQPLPEVEHQEQREASQQRQQPQEQPQEQPQQQGQHMQQEGDNDRQMLADLLERLYTNPTDFDLVNSEHLIQLLEEPWKNDAGAPRSKLDPSTVLTFARGITVLGDMVIPSHLYRPFLIAFCWSYEPRRSNGTEIFALMHTAYGIAYASHQPSA